MKCSHCNYESENNFDKCPVCGTPTNPAANAAFAYQNAPKMYQPYNYCANNPYNSAYTHKKTTGEKAAIGVAIVVSIISILVVFILFIGYISYEASYAYDLYTSSDYDDFYNDFYNDFYSQIPNNYDNQYNISSPAPKNTPIEFNENLYSFSNGYINTTYEVELEETYRGEAAIKMLEGATLPQLDSTQEIYLAKFKVTITEQGTKSYVTLYPTYAAAFNELGNSYSVLKLDYDDNKELLMEGESGTRWVAFVIEKDVNPYISWDKYENKYFLNKDEAISNQSNVNAGEAIEESDSTSSEE